MISAILLAAGQSKRMNGENKLKKKINNQPLIKHSINNILESDIDELIVVVGYQEEIIKKLISKNEKVKIISNKNFKNGIASSIKEGLKHLSKKTEYFFICLGDMPNVNKQIYNSLIKFRNNYEIIIPTYKGQRGNPVLFEKSMKEIIINIEGDSGAKKIINMYEKKIFNFETNDQSIVQDFNTQESFS
tara:strand:+ start:24 stop:590 length:567 start_codon:yes stop_codon:yes gene_type:complete